MTPESGQVSTGPSASSGSDRAKLLFVSCGGLGLSPFAPGTVGTLGGVAIAWALAGSALFGVWVLVAAVLLYVVGRSLGDWSGLNAMLDWLKVERNASA